MIYTEVFVTIDNKTVGKLFFRKARGQEYQEFQYMREWITSGFQIDVELPLVEGIQRTKLGEFGCFSDVSPDSWGRMLLCRIYKQNEGRDTLFPSEYLLSVSDIYRLGAFRFYDTEKNLIGKETDKIITGKDIQTFQFAINQMQKGMPISDADFIKIIRCGSSMGGARPKMSIIDEEDESLWIAKFSSIHDTYNIPAREAISLAIAKQCNINVPEFRLYLIDSKKSVLLVKRFDRDNTTRIPFLSAKSLLMAKDGQSNDYSYLDIAECIVSYCRDYHENLLELYKRLLLNVLIGNRDDHLRNHGFLFKDGTWTLSPAYDLEISPDSMTHCLALNDKGSLICPLSEILTSSEYYGISYKTAKEILLDMAENVYAWKSFGHKLNITNTALENMPLSTHFIDEIRYL